MFEQISDGFRRYCERCDEELCASVDGLMLSDERLRCVYASLDLELQLSFIEEIRCTISIFENIEICSAAYDECNDIVENCFGPISEPYCQPDDEMQARALEERIEGCSLYDEWEPSSFVCSDTLTLEYQLRCDGNADCPDGRDELLCP